jgi:hypothetical protein
MKTGWIYKSVLVLVIFGGAITASAQSETATLQDQCRALMIDPPPLSDPPESVEIVIPRENQDIYGSTVNVRVVPSNFSLDAGGHWHLWVDNDLAGMIYGDRAVIELEPGTYRLCAFVGDEEHIDLGIPDGIMVTVREALRGTPTAAPDVGAVAPTPRESANPLVIIVLGGLAALGGVVVGSRLGKRKNGSKLGA